MQAPRTRTRGRISVLVSLLLAVAGSQALLASPSSAGVGTKIDSFPYTQNWSSLSSASTWTDFQGVEGFLTGNSITASNPANSVDPGTLTAEGTLASNLTLSNLATPNTYSSGAVAGFYAATDKTVALSATGTQAAPVLVFHLDTTGESGFNVAYDVQDLDSSGDDQPTRVALQYRVGNTGGYTNVPAAYVADATVASNAAVGSTAVSAALPAAVDNQADVYLRVITIDNASGSNEHVGIDNINITSGAAPAPLDLTAPSSQSDTVGQEIAPVTLSVSGGNGDYTFDATGLPPGLELDTDTGEITGTPTDASGSPYTVNISVTDTASGSDSDSFQWTIDPAPGVTAIADIQGTGDASPADGQVRTTEGVVTATYPDGGFAGFYIQTPGADTPGASDAIFVFDDGGFDAYPAVGDEVRVQGVVDEFGTAPNTLTELVITQNSQVVPADLTGTVTPKTLVPGTDCALNACPANAAAINALREPVEGELFQPTGDYTVTDAYDGSAYTGSSASSSNFGEVGLAAESDIPLISQTEVEAPSPSASSPRVQYNNAHRMILDDGASTTFWNTVNPPTAPGRLQTSPWNTETHTVRVGAAVTFPAPVVLDWRNNVWKLLPQTTVVGAPTAGADPQFEQDRPAQPADVGGDLKLATFNVLNYFTTLGVDYDAGPGTCSAFVDKNNNPIAVNSCSGSGPRGAWDATNFARQEAKIVDAINTMDADIVSLEEIENSRKVDGVDRDEAIGALVDALNDDAGETRWAFVPSPATLPAVADEDVIRTGFIYDPDTVDVIGEAQMLIGSAPFDNAREPFAAAFKAAGAADADGFAIVVNHFKSKGSGGATGDNVDTGNGAGAYNGDRTRQAEALATFADDFATAKGVDAVFLTGDFNAYSMEDPVQSLISDGYTNLESTDDPEEESYSFDGASGSLDHVFANAAALDLVNGVDIWEINANETVFNQYSRYDYITPRLYQPGPFSASDHNPEVVGIDAPDEPATRDIQILGTNDFHGRLLNDSGAPTAGAAVLSGAVKQLRDAEPDTAFVAAGDLIGASTFESFIAKDKPTIDALNEAGLDVSAAGNHEFDQGYDDLVNRVMAPYDPVTNEYGGAEWEYIAANVRKNSDDSHALAPTWTQDFGSVRVGYVGAVTEHLGELVSPGGISEIHVTDVVAEANAAADDLVANGADVVVLLVHEGAPMTSCTDIGNLGTDTDFGSIVKGVNDNIDAIVSGHTHLAYDCSFPVPGWTGRDVTERPVVSAGQYGMALNQIVFTVETATGDVQAKSQALLNLKTCATNCAGSGTPTYTFNYPADPAVTAIVNDAVAESNVLGAVKLGEIAGPLKRGKLQSGTENRGAESDLGNLVAEVQRWATSTPTAGSAQIAFMNPGGLRDDMLGLANPVGDPDYPRDLTYKQAAVVQPFANTLVNMDLTGAQIKATLEQQWQPAGASRPFLKLGISEGFTYTSDPSKPEGSRITGMWLNGTPIGLATVYSVTVNSFLSTGGDNFAALAGGTGKQDTGQTDLQAMVDYMAEFANTGEGDDPLPVPAKQNGVHVTFPVGAPASYEPGEDVVFDVSGFSFTNATDPLDTNIEVKLGDTTLGTFPLDNAAQTALPGFDVTGKASIDVTIPADTTDGSKTLTLVGPTTDTEVEVPVAVDDDVEPIQILGTNDFHGRLLNDSGAPTAGAAVLSGAVKQLRDANANTAFVAAGDLIGASTFESFIAKDKPTIDALNEAGLDVSAAGNHEFDQGYDDLVNRVMAPYDPVTNEYGGAEWEYIAANVRKNSDDSHALAPTWTQEFGDVKVGYVGAVTEHLGELVSPGGISEIHVTDVVAEVNDAAEDLKADGADVVVMLVHEGAPMTNCGQIEALAPNTDFGEIVHSVSSDVDAIVSGHTHLAYDCEFTVDEWVTEGRDVTKRPVVSAGQYGMALNQIVFDVDTDTGEVVAKSQALLNLKTCATNCAGSGTPTYTFNYPADPAVTAIVNDAVAESNVLGAVKLGEIAGPLKRGKLQSGTENRGAESDLGNLVAEVQRWATSTPTAGSAQIAFMNPGGLRDDMLGLANPVGDPDYPRDLTYKQAAVVQPFANTLVNMDLTGAQIKATLEQQWQPAGASRPFLKLGISEGFTYTSDPSKPEGSRITGMWLNGTPIGLATVYSVTVNSFLSTGGDNFAALAGGTGKQDTGQTDLQAMVDYMAEFANTGEGDDPLPVPAKQNGVHVTFPVGAPASYEPGEDVVFDVSGFSFTNATDPLDTNIEVKLGDTTLGTFPLDNAAQTALPGFDVTGKASIDVTIPADQASGPLTLMLVGPTTGTEIPVTVNVALVQEIAAEDVTITYGEEADLVVTVTGNSTGATGTVEFFSGATSLGTAPMTAGSATLTLAERSIPPGTQTITAEYSGGGGYAADTVEFELTVEKADATVVADDTSTAADSTTVHVTVSSTIGVNPTGTVEIYDGDELLGAKSLSGGSANVLVDTSGLGVGPHELDVVYNGSQFFNGDDSTFTLTKDKASPVLAITAPTMTYGKSSVVTVNVSAPGETPTGTVQVRRGATVLGTGTVTNGKATITLPARSLPPGNVALTALYSGDANVSASAKAFSLTVVKAKAAVDITIKPGTIKVNKTKGKVVVRVTAVGVDPVNGKVEITVQGQGTKKVTLDDGKAVLNLAIFKQTGKKSVKVTYLGNALVAEATEKAVITVKP